MTPHDRSSLREAADWFAQMRGPDAGSSRQAFDHWLATSKANREAYSRIAETFALGKRLAEPGFVETGADKPPKRPVLLTAVVAVAITVAGLSYLSLSHGPPPSVARNESLSLKTRVGEIRVVTLMDGSRVTLDTDTELAVEMLAGRRDIRMLRGRARFDVAHDGRPFVVRVADGAIIARGTLFDVRIIGNRTEVQLLRGAIDVERTDRTGSRRDVRRLLPGQAVAFGASERITSPTRPDRSQILQPGWPDALLAFDHVTLGDLATEANRYSTARLIVASDLSSIPVSGTFRVGDPRRLANRLANLLGVDSVPTTGGDVELVSITSAGDRRAAAEVR